MHVCATPEDFACDCTIDDQYRSHHEISHGGRSTSTVQASPLSSTSSHFLDPTTVSWRLHREANSSFSA